MTSLVGPPWPLNAIYAGFSPPWWKTSDLTQVRVGGASDLIWNGVAHLSQNGIDEADGFKALGAIVFLGSIGQLALFSL